nr:hypothetical protein Iba_chr04cCG0130 [Ipomoea batatas]
MAVNNVTIWRTTGLCFCLPLFVQCLDEKDSHCQYKCVTHSTIIVCCAKRV